MTRSQKTLAPGLHPGLLPPVYRELRPAEHRLLEPHLMRLSPASRNLRFGSAVSLVTVQRYCRNDGKPLPIICGAFIGGVLRGVVEIRFGKDAPMSQAEIAISVEDDWQDIGIGSKLMELALERARDHHITQLEVDFLPHNMPMRRLAEKFGATFSHQRGLTTGIFSLADPGFAVDAGSKRPQ